MHQTECGDDDEEDRAVQRRAKRLPEIFTGCDLEGIDRRGDHRFVHAVEVQPLVCAPARVEGRRVECCKSEHARRDELHERAFTEGQIGAEAKADRQEPGHRFEDVDGDAGERVFLPGHEVAAEDVPRVAVEQRGEGIHSVSSRPVKFKKTSSSVAGRATCCAALMPACAKRASSAELSSVYRYVISPWRSWRRTRPSSGARIASRSTPISSSTSGAANRSINVRGVPAAKMRPSSMITKRSHKRAASSI